MNYGRREKSDGTQNDSGRRKKVKVGSHYEQKSGILNGVKGFFSAKSAFKEVNDYEWVENVEYRPTYDYVPKMKEIVEEIPVKKSPKK